jgi:hypothetical protein
VFSYSNTHYEGFLNTSVTVHGVFCHNWAKLFSITNLYFLTK